MNVRLVPNTVSNDAAGSAEAEKKAQMIRTLRALVRETCQLRNQGVAYSKLAHSQGYADGYMRLLTDAGYLTQKELLGIVVEVRRGVDGPATRNLEASQTLPPPQAALTA